MHRGVWAKLSIKKQTASGVPNDVIDLHNNGTVAWSDSYLESRALKEVFISKYEAEMTVWISVLKCSDEGSYVCGASGPFTIPEAESTLVVICELITQVLTGFTHARHCLW